MLSEWTMVPGATTTREQLVVDWGGSKYSGGIVAADASNTIFLFSDPDQGEQFGYGWDGVSTEGDAYYYTGAGQKGDQELKDRNGAVLGHVDAGRTLRLFVAEGLVPGSQVKLQRYVGEFVIDPASPYRMEPSPTKAGESRVVVVFRLLPVGDTDLPGLAESGEFAPDSNDGPISILMPPEVDSTYFYETTGAPPTVAEKKENQLVADFRTWLGGPETRFRRWAIRVPNTKIRLLTDIYDQQLKILFEAKGSSSRAYLRLGFGQLLDYWRYVPEAKSAYLLIPSRPSDELLELFVSYDIGCVWRSGLGFESSPDIFGS